MSTENEIDNAQDYFHGAYTQEQLNTAKLWIDREIYALQNSLVVSLLSIRDDIHALGREPIKDTVESMCDSFDETNSYLSDDDGEEISWDADRRVWVQCCGSLAQLDISDVQDEYYSPDTQSHEVYQWYLVSNWAAGKLEEQGETVVTDGESHWWGRSCCGQGIEQDGTWQAIAKANDESIRESAAA